MNLKKKITLNKEEVSTIAIYIRIMYVFNAKMNIHAICCMDKNKYMDGKII